MKWYVKAFVQNAIAQLPAPMADPLYFQLQRRLGELRNPRFDMRFNAALEVAEILADGGIRLAGKRVLEVGTGRTIDLPMGLWLMGADEVVSVDITRLLRADLVDQAIAHVERNWSDLRARMLPFSEAATLDERFAILRAARGLDDDGLRSLLHRMGVDYRAPADAAWLSLPDRSIDLHVSFVVMQHVPPKPMLDILCEGRRVLKRTGHMVHIANTSDHFSHADPALSPLHFLRYSERQWDLIAGNRFMYQNRMRADDYYARFEEAGLALVARKELTDERALADLRAGLPLHPDFRGRPAERDAIIRFTALLTRDDTQAAHTLPPPPRAP